MKDKIARLISEEFMSLDYADEFLTNLEQADKKLYDSLMTVMWEHYEIELNDRLVTRAEMINDEQKIS